jgi:hypothetical protein
MRFFWRKETRFEDSNPIWPRLLRGCAQKEDKIDAVLFCEYPTAYPDQSRYFRANSCFLQNSTFDRDVNGLV